MHESLPRGDSSHTFDHLLNSYSLAATAACVSMLALSPPSFAEVVITKKHIPLDAGKNVFLDINHDGVADFEFEPIHFFSTTRNGQYLGHQTVLLKGLSGGKAVGKHEFGKGVYASALMRGAKIGPSAHFSSANGKITIERNVNCSCSQSAAYGNWDYYAGNNRFLGVKVTINGETHFGWVRMRAPFIGAPPTEITGYAYETVADKTITAGSSSAPSTQALSKQESGPSLGMLASGAAESGPVWRRRED